MMNVIRLREPPERNSEFMKTYFSGKEITSLLIVCLFIALMIYSWLSNG